MTRFSYSGDTNTATIYSNYNHSVNFEIKGIGFAEAQEIVKAVQRIEAEAVSGAEKLMLDALSSHVAQRRVKNNEQNNLFAHD